MKKTLTKNEAREFLKDKVVITNSGNARAAEAVFEKAGYTLDDGCIGAPYIRRTAGYENEYGFYNQYCRDDYSMINISDLLAIEIVEEPRLKCVPGCKPLTGNETIHHADCPYYPESLTKIHNDHRALLGEAADWKKKYQEAYGELMDIEKDVERLANERDGAQMNLADMSDELDGVKKKLEEAVKLLEECCPIMHRMTPDVKARSQINKIEQFLKANRP